MSTWFDQDDYQEMRHGMRGIAAALKTLHTALNEVGLPPAVVDPVVVSWFNKLMQPDLTTMMGGLLKNLGQEEEEDE